MRWGEEYKVLQTRSEQNDWIIQKVEERKAINAVRVMMRFENSTNPTLFQHAKLCEKWAESIKQAQEMEKTALIDSRKAMCVDSLLCRLLHSIDM